MKKSIKYLCSLSLLLTITFISSCDKDDEDGGPADGWTELQRTAFITACKTGDGETEGGTEEQCACVFDATSKDFSYQEYQNITIEQALSLAFAVLPCYTE